jgi:hypothetical protein
MRKWFASPYFTNAWNDPAEYTHTKPIDVSIATITSNARSPRIKTTLLEP